MKIAVTGHTGFIGKKLVKKLLSKGHEVYLISRNYEKVNCDRIYHLACPSTTESIFKDPIGIMDIIIDGTRKALQICPTALFVNASTMGIFDLTKNPQGCYNIAKRCMETYIEFYKIKYKNYRIPSVYGPNMHDDNFIKRCIDGKAYRPTEPEKKYYIAHVDDVVDALIELKPINIEETTLGKIYDQFVSGKRTLDKI